MSKETSAYRADSYIAPDHIQAGEAFIADSEFLASYTPGTRAEVASRMARLLNNLDVRLFLRPQNEGCSYIVTNYLFTDGAQKSCVVFGGKAEKGTMLCMALLDTDSLTDLLSEID
jgi:hypothetical protein